MHRTIVARLVLLPLLTTGAMHRPPAAFHIPGTYNRIQTVMSDGTFVWAATNGKPGTVHKFSAIDGAFLGSYSTMGQSPLSMAFDGANVWIANYDDGVIVKLGRDGRILGKTSAAGRGIEGMIYAAGKIWVAGCERGVSRVNPKTARVEATYAVGTCPQGITFDGRSLWLAGWERNIVTKISTRGRVEARLPVHSPTTGMAFDGTHVWVSNGRKDTITKIRASDAKIIGTVRVGPCPRGMTFDGDSLWVVNGGGVSRVRPADDSVETFPLDITVRDVAFDGEHLWIGDARGTAIRKF